MSEGLGFLLSDVARLMRRRADERARSIGASLTQWRVLKILDREPGLNQGQIAEQLEVEPITCCRMIDRLEESGLVERRRDPADRRVWRIHLTDKAHPVLGELHTVGNGIIEEMLAGLNEAQRAALRQSLNVMRTNLSQLQETKETANG